MIKSKRGKNQESKHRKRAIAKSLRRKTVTQRLAVRDRSVTLSRHVTNSSELRNEAVIVLLDASRKFQKLVWLETSAGSENAAQVNKSRKDKKRGKSHGLSDIQEFCRCWSGLDHPGRLAIIDRLLHSSATHAQIKALTQLEPGPLYHHIHHLERSNILMSTRRNTYELTEIGRVIGMVIPALHSLLKQTARRSRRTQ